MAFIESCKDNNVAIIVDESHKIKNLGSKQTCAIFEIQKQLKFRAKNVYTYLLTGTPFTTGYIDLYAQLKILGSDMTKGTFEWNFCEKGNLPGLLGWQQPIVGYKNIDKLYETIHKFAITIKSEDVVDLPEQVFVEHVLPLNPTFDIFTKEFVKPEEVLAENNRHELKLEDLSRYVGKKKVNNPYFRNIAYPDLKWIADTSGLFWLRCRQLSIGFQGNVETAIWYDRHRLEKLEEFLAEHEDNYLLFYNYTPELLEIYDICEKLGYNIDVYCGEMKSMFFYEKYCKLSEADKLTHKKNIIIANFASGSTGMNWQEYNKCIIFSMPLFKDYEQGIKRIHRLGQKQTTFYHIFYQKNWLDMGMKYALDNACDYSESMFKADLTRINHLMNDEEIDEIVDATKALDNVDSNEEKHFSDFVKMLLVHPECKCIADKKQIDISVFLTVSTVEEYNELTGYSKLTKNEFATLKNAI